MKRVLLLAGEESGVLYARQLSERLRSQYPQVEIRGYADYGFEISDLAVFGIWAVIRKIGYFLKVKRTLERAILEWRPEVVCTIDYPGMNLKLAAFAKAHAIRAVHVVCPQVWAWHQGRIPKIERSLDRLCCFFPFEPRLFRAGFAKFVGHPLAAEIKPSAPALSDEGVRTLAVLPGSRLSEIGYHLPTLIDVIRQLQAELKLRVVIPAASACAYAAIERMLQRRAADLSDVIRLQSGGARSVLAAADAAIVASGTATLEAAMINCPTVLVYKVGKLLGILARFLIKGVKHVGLANVVAEKAGVGCPTPELLQGDFTVERVLAEIKPLLIDPKLNLKSRQALTNTMKLLSANGDPIGNIVSEL